MLAFALINEIMRCCTPVRAAEKASSSSGSCRMALNVILFLKRQQFHAAMIIIFHHACIFYFYIMKININLIIIYIVSITHVR